MQLKGLLPLLVMGRFLFPKFSLDKTQTFVLK